MVPAVLAARDCRHGSSIVRALDLHLGLPDFGKPPENSGVFRLGAARLHCNAWLQGISLVLRIKKLDLFKYVIT
jgi:hypothetical protein